MENKIPSPIFILGAQRSGTTLLRLMLNAHSKIAIPEEARFLTPLLKKKYLNTVIKKHKFEKLVQYLKNSEQFKLWNYDSSAFYSNLTEINEITVTNLLNLLYTSYCVFEGKQIWGDKSLFFSYITILNKMFPIARFINIVRDGRDVFDSWRKMDKKKNNAAMIAVDWSFKLFLIERSLKRIPKEYQLTIRYEDILSNPTEMAKKVCRFVKVDFEAEMLEFYKTSRRYIGRHHSKLIYKKIEKSNASKWRRNLSPQEINIFEVLSGRFLKKYGYETVSNRLSRMETIHLLIQLCEGLAKKMVDMISTRRAYRAALLKGTATEGILVGQKPEDKAAF